jgi:hypothetical protein
MLNQVLLVTCSIESTQVLGKPVPYYNLFNGLLSLLAVLHAYW